MKLSEFALENQSFTSIESLFEFCIIATKWEKSLGFELHQHTQFLRLPKISINVRSVYVDFEEEFLFICKVLLGCEMMCVLPNTSVFKLMSLLKHLDLSLYVPLVVYIHMEGELSNLTTRIPSKGALLRLFEDFQENADDRSPTALMNDLKSNRRILDIYEILLSQ